MDVARPRLAQGAILIAAAIGEMGGFVLPVMVGAIVERYGVAPGQVGFLISAQIALLSLATFGLAPVVHRVDRRACALAGAAIIVAGNLASAFAPSFGLLVALRALTGLGEGIVVAAMTAAAAQAPSPERLFALSWLTIVVMSVAVAIGVPLLLVAGGTRLAFLAMAASVALGAASFLAFPRHVRAAPATLPRIAWRDPATLRLGLATALFAVTINGAWAFIERIGHRHGLDVTQVGYAILFSSLLALGAPLLTLLLGDRFGRARPIGVMLAAAATGAMLNTHAIGTAGFVAGLALSSFCLVFGMPYLLGLAAAMDPAGRVATAVRAFGAAGNTLTPSLSGSLLLLGAGYGAIGWTALACAAVSALLVLPVARRQDRRVAPRGIRLATGA